MTTLREMRDHVGIDFGTLVPITPDDADRVRAKWGGGDE